ncbi:MAG TPA: response regulator [Xanthobacteraceae bacterium]|nr:response regulator [Xanthobacteraceae bacterium]
MRSQPGPASGAAKGVPSGSEIFVVDDDDDMRELLVAILSLEGYPVKSFADGETFLRTAGTRTPVCLFLDVVMPGRSGIDVLKELAARRYEAPIFLISGRGDTPMVVDALKSGARDFLHKPFDPYAAVQRVRDAVEIWASRTEKQSSVGLEDKEFPGHVRLTRREAEVLAQIMRGASSKDIGTALGIGKRTVDNFRMNIMKKLGAKNIADLVRIIMT